MNNDEAKAKVQRRQAERLAVLRAGFDLSNGGQRHHTIKPDDVAEKIGIEMDEVRDAVDYLIGEGLVERAALGGIFSVTHAGRVEVESTLTEPETGTSHFPPAVIHIFNTTNNNSTVNGNVAANSVGGSGNTTTGTQTINTAMHQEARAQLAELRRLAAELKQPAHIKDADDIIVDWEEAVETNDKAIVKRLPRDGRTLGGLFSAENIAAAVHVVPPVVEALTKLLGG